MSEVILVLLVEDDRHISCFLEDGLIDAGFKVLANADPAQAIAELEKDATRFGAIITDIKLGDRGSGWDAARRSRELVAEMPVVYMSGDSVADWSAYGVPGSVMIQKPFVLPQIITAISMLLNTCEV